MHFDEEEQKLMRPFQFISTKPEVIVINTAEGDLNSGKSNTLQSLVENYVSEKGLAETTKVITLCGKIEMEIAQLSAEEAKAFLEDLGIEEPALKKLIKVTYDRWVLFRFLLPARMR